MTSCSMGSFDYITNCSMSSFNCNTSCVRLCSVTCAGAAQIVDLNLDNCRSTQILGLTDEFVKLEVLSLDSVGLTTLKGFPTLPSLKKV